MTSATLEACRLSILGVAVTILVEDGDERSQAVAAAICASSVRITEAVVAELQTAPSLVAIEKSTEQEWDIVDQGSGPSEQSASDPDSPNESSALPSTASAAPVASEDMAARMTAARLLGRETAAATKAGRPVPAAVSKLKHRVWVVTGCDPAVDGIYAKGSTAKAACQCRPQGLVRGFAALAEARAYVDGLGVDVPDRRC